MPVAQSWRGVTFLTTFGFLVLSTLMSQAGEVKKLTYKDGQKLADGSVRPAIKLQPDDAIEVSLTSNPGSTGFSWQVASDSTKLFDVTSKKLEPQGTPRPGGATDTRVFTAKLKPGVKAPPDRQVLKIILSRVRGEPIADTFEVPIEIVPPGVK